MTMTANDLRPEAREVLILWSTAKDRASLGACYRDEAYNLRMAARSAATAARLTREESRTISDLLRGDPFAWSREDRAHVGVCPECESRRAKCDEEGCCLTCGTPLVTTTEDGADMLLDYLARRDDESAPPDVSARCAFHRVLDELDALRSEVGYEDGDHAAVERDLLDEIVTLARAVVDGGAR